MKRIFIPTTSGSDWQHLLAKPDLHWKPGRSAMAAAACWEASAPRLPPEISEALASSGDPSLIGLELLAAFPEWEVDLPGGDRPSQTDVLALVRNNAGLMVLGVEAKVDEPFGPTVGEKRNGASPGQRTRLAFLEQTLACTEPLQDSIRYQLLHRCVSALLTATAFHAPVAVMLVHSFSPESKWREDFDAFAQALGARSLTSNLFEVNMTDSPRLLVGWCRGPREFLEAELPGKRE